MAPFSKILSSRPSWLRVSIRGRPGENPTWRESAPRRRHSFRQRITELAAQWTRRATSFKDRSSSNSFSARLRRSESSSAEPFGRIWTSCTLEVYYCIILCEVNSAQCAHLPQCALKRTASERTVRRGQRQHGIWLRLDKRGSVPTATE